jgi:hypothetical protein
MRKEEVKQKFIDLKWSVQSKVCSLREDAKENIKKTAKFVVENKEIVAATIIACCGVAKKGFEYKARKAEAESRFSTELRVWDAKLGIMWYLRRPLTNEERFYLEQQKAQGRPVGEILRELNVLK